jgi:hypothetical protein
MKGYYHKGTMTENGNVDTGKTISDAATLKLMLKDDRFHLHEPVTGNFEWWYFDIIDRTSEYKLKIVAHIGTDPLRNKVYPQLALSITASGSGKAVILPYSWNDFSGSDEFCHILLKNDFEAWVEYNSQIEYYVKVNVPFFSCNLHFIGQIEGWKPLGNDITMSRGSKTGKFAWIIPVPKASVSGEFIYEGKSHQVMNATGYHDHNFWSVNRNKPLFIDDAIRRWYWGKCYCEDYTIIFMDTYFRTNRLRSLMIAKEDEIIHSSNNLVDISEAVTEKDNTLKATYPSQLSIQLNDKNWQMDLQMYFNQMIDKRDLLEEIHLVPKWIIKSFIARPVYFGIYSDAVLTLENKKINGFGNYEVMAFRNV